MPIYVVGCQLSVHGYRSDQEAKSVELTTENCD